MLTINIMCTLLCGKATGGRRAPRRTADGRTPRRALELELYSANGHCINIIHIYIYIMCLHYDGGKGDTERAPTRRQGGRTNTFCPEMPKTGSPLAKGELETKSWFQAGTKSRGCRLDATPHHRDRAVSTAHPHPRRHGVEASFSRAFVPRLMLPLALMEERV